MASPPSSPQDDFILHLQSAPTLTQSQQTHPPNPVFLLPILSPCWSHDETVSLVVTHWQDVTDAVTRRCLAASQVSSQDQSFYLLSFSGNPLLLYLFSHVASITPKSSTASLPSP
ncbi:hypothetical protein C1H46_018479 [Malus baccata]|uniref:Uncharacterized protein n=1 Tax=Malus baccata TaxID=106549 RepID=A0A540MB04_MALBA|nr:hypothetical protein C1H46_018479 [Malus baccata]